MEFSALLERMKPPALYEKSELPFWDDEHISKGMLAAHLDPDGDAATRNAAFLDRSARWIASLLPPEEYPSLVDFGCGPGLYAERFCRAGYAVTGIDLSPRSIDYARQTAEREGLPIRYRNADYLTVDLGEQFDLAVMIYCDYGALSVEDRAAALRRVSAHLRRGGRFLLDVSSVAAFRAFKESQNWSVCENGGYWSAEPYLALERKCRFCENVTLHQAGILTDAQLRMYHIWHTYFTPESIRQEAEAAGFALIGTWGDVAGAPDCETSPTIALLLEKR